MVITEDRSDPGNIVSNFGVTWNDIAEYNAYLNILPISKPGNATERSQIHTVSATYTNTERTVVIWSVVLALMAYGLFVICPTVKIIDGMGGAAFSPYLMLYFIAAFFGVGSLTLSILLALWELFHLAFRRGYDTVVWRDRFLHLWSGYDGRLSRGRYL